MPSFLPEELLVEIFSWLPVKSLVRFSCVSKSCKSLISDSEFVKLHLHRSSSTNSDIVRVRLRLCYDRHDNGRVYISSSSVTSLLETTDSAIVAVPSCFSEYEFVGTCNGLVCMMSPFDLDNVNQKHFFRFRFWNPATRSISPNSPPLYDGSVFGFGYDCSTDTYKVVGVDSYVSTMVSVYDMSDNCQRTIQVSQLPRMDVLELAVYVSNNLIWLAHLGEDETESTNTDLYTIVSFDMGKEDLMQLSLPYTPQSDAELDDFVLILGVLRDTLCVSQNDNKTRNFVVWQMKEFGVHKSWTQLFNIIGHGHFFPWPCFATHLSENGDALLMSKSGVCQAVLYTRRDNKLEGMKISNNIVGCYVEN